MILKQVIHYPLTNSIEVTWTNEDGVNVRVHSYSANQMSQLRIDLLDDVTDYDSLITSVETSAVPDETLEQQAARLAIEQEGIGQDTLRTNLKADAVFDQLRTATPAQINTFVNNQFAAFTVQQRAVMKMLIQVAALVVRRA